MLMFVASPAFAQSGFTVLANVGVGFQNDEFYEETATGIGGLNVGAGVFLTPKIAVLGRISSTSAIFDASGARQTSTVYGGTIQMWLNNWASIEGGAGLGRWSDAFNDSDNGFGIIVAFHASVFQRGSHHIRAGVEYAPVFTDVMVQNIGVVVGYQFVKK
jgi:hypothetical protein